MFAATRCCLWRTGLVVPLQASCDLTTKQPHRLYSNLRTSLNCLQKVTFDRCAIQQFSNIRWNRIYFYHRPGSKTKLINRFSAITTDQIQKKKSDGRAKLIETKKKVQEAKKIVQEQLKERFDGMRENIYTVPNALCLTRIGLTPLLGYFVCSEQFSLALSIGIVAGVTDLLDGYIARRYPSQRSELGSFLDPMADKLLVATLFATLTYVHLIPLALTALIIARDLILVVSALVIRYQSLPPPKTLARYFDITMATARISPTKISKFNTFVQLVMVSVALGAPVLNYVSHPALEILWYLTALTTVSSGLSYIFARDAVKFIRPKKNLKN